MIDEAGDTGTSLNASRHLVVAAILHDDIRSLQRIITRLRRVLGKKARLLSEIKGVDAARHMPRLITRVLTQLSLLDIEIYAAILDKHTLIQTNETELLYRYTFAQCIHFAMRERHRLQVLMDRRYTKSALQLALVSAVAAEQLPGTILTIAAEDSRAEPALQVADIVAWSIFDKYEHGSQNFYDLIAPRITAEIILSGRGANKKPAHPER